MERIIRQNRVLAFRQTYKFQGFFYSVKCPLFFRYTRTPDDFNLPFTSTYSILKILCTTTIANGEIARTTEYILLQRIQVGPKADVS